MRTLGFHYHIPVTHGPPYRIPAFLGVFLDALASHVERLDAVLHEGDDPGITPDGELRAPNIRLRSLGAKPSIPARWLRQVHYGRLVSSWAADWDGVLIRAPTPLGRTVAHAALAAGAKVFLLVVGDHRDSIPTLRMALPRRLAATAWCHYTMNEVEDVARDAGVVMVNNPHDIARYRGLNGNTHEVRTTTIGADEIDPAPPWDGRGPFRILYVGRLATEKGVVELLEAVRRLRSRPGAPPVELHLAGAPDDPRYLEVLAPAVQAAGAVLHGHVALGPPLWDLYRSCHAFVIASPANEGFPRAIWEAMAKGLPVVATRVGGIPHVLEHGRDALLVPPGDADAMASAFETLQADPELRRRLGARGVLRARENTLDARIPEMVRLMEAGART